jgi:glutamate racemase
MPNSAPIGIFDSGVGGLTVARAIADLLPKERFIYFGDTAHLPYGDKSAEAIIEYSMAIAHELIGLGAKAIIIACNTASAIAHHALLEEFGSQLPVINVLNPVAEAVSLQGHEHIGVIGTRATIKSNAYARCLRSLKAELQITSLATPLLVPVIEEGLIQSTISKEVLLHYLGQPELQGIDALILGCTHYPILHREIDRFYKGRVHVVDSPQIVAETVSEVLSATDLLANTIHGETKFYVSDYTETFHQMSRMFFVQELELIEKHIW